MQVVRVWLLAVLVQLLLVTLAWSGSPVWKISKGERHLYLAGTIHLLAPSDYPLAPGFEQAYAGSAKLVFEADLLAMKRPEVQQQVLQKMLYRDGRTLRQVLKPETMQALDRHLQARGMALERMQTFKPGMLSLVLTVVEMQRLGMGGTGVDEFYLVKGRADGKQVAFLEEVGQQLEYLAALGEGSEDQMVSHTLRDLVSLPQILHDMKARWRSGDLTALEAQSIAPMKKDFPAVYEQLLVRRNLVWMPQIEAMLATAEVEYVLVGMLHLAGADGLLRLLEARGYTVQMLTP